MAFLYLFCLYNQSIQLTQYFSQHLFNRTDISWKIHFLFSMSEWQLPHWWIVYEMNVVSLFQMTGLCGVLFIGFVCCDLKCRIYFSLVLCFFFLSELEEDKHNIHIYKEQLRCPSNPPMNFYETLWIAQILGI